MGAYESDDAQDTASPPEETDETETAANTAVVDNKVLMGADGRPPKEGDEIVVRVVKVYGDESEIEYAPAKGGEKPTPPSEMTANQEFDSME